MPSDPTPLAAVRSAVAGMDQHPLAAVALRLAHELEEGNFPPAPIAKELRETLAALRDLTPREQASASDDIAKRRAARRAKTTAG
jgi:hypothetical protein